MGEGRRETEMRKREMVYMRELEERVSRKKGVSGKPRDREKED